MLLTFNVEGLLLRPLLLLFLSNGAFYYFFPEYHYSIGGGGGWIVWIKYACILVSILIISVAYKLKQTAVMIVLLFLSLEILGIIFVSKQHSYVLIFSFLAAVVAVILPALATEKSTFSKRYFQILLLSLIGLNFAGCIYEFVSGSVFSSYLRSGFRSTGIFVNPNNTGIVAALLGVAALMFGRGRFYKLAATLMSCVVIALTGSKTGLFVYLVGIFFIHPVLLSILALLSASSMLFFSSALTSFIQSYELRTVDVESGSIRIQSWASLLETFTSVSFVNLLFGFEKEVLVDNAYLDLLSHSGFLVLLVFIFVQVYSILRIISISKNLAVMHLLFFLAMLTTNIPRLWPVGYAYWFLVGFSLLGKNSLNQYFHSPVPRLSLRPAIAEKILFK
jgi:hypothetical protein